MFGHDPSLSEFITGKSLYEYQSATRDRLLSVMNLFARGEQLGDVALDMGTSNLLPLFDFFPWCRKSSSDFDFLGDHTRGYLEALNPLVMLTLGAYTSSLAYGDFSHTHGIKAGDLTRNIGRLAIRSYGTPGEGREDSCVLVIPCSILERADTVHFSGQHSPMSSPTQ